MRKLTIIFTLVSLCILSGCIKDGGGAECRTFLYFSYLGDHNTEIFPQKIGKVNLYIYDDADGLIQSMVLDEKRLREEQGVWLDLPTNNYHVVCWGNPYEDTQINDPSSLEAGIVGAPNYFTGNPIATNDSLYMGSKDVHIIDYISAVDTLYFGSAHIKMAITLNGLDESTSPIEIVMENLSPTVDFHKTFSTTPVTYYPLLSKDGNNFLSKFNVLRFNDDNPVVINLVNKSTQETIYSLPLKDFMVTNHITVDGINEAFVGVAFIFNGISVTPQPWEEETIRPGI